MKPSSPVFPADHFTALADIARTLGHAHRLALLEHIAQEERSVEQLAQLSGVSVANASQHLQQLKRAGIVQTRRDGKRVLYSLGAGPLAPLLEALRGYLAYQHAEIREVALDSLSRRERLEGISIEELLLQMQSQSVVLLDVRPEDEFASGHLPGALNIPADALQQRLAELPKGKQVIAYCRGPYCVLSTDAINTLHAHGLPARRLRAGFDDWKAAGLSVESPIARLEK